jgi:hypothetical protein
MGVQGCRAIRTNDPQVLKPIVIAFSIDVIEDQTHATPAPNLVLPAKLTSPFLQPAFEEPPLEARS